MIYQYYPPAFDILTRGKLQGDYLFLTIMLRLNDGEWIETTSDFVWKLKSGKKPSRGETGEYPGV